MTQRALDPDIPTLDPDRPGEAEVADLAGTSRRRFLAYLLAAPTLVAAADLVVDAARPQRADAVVPSPPEFSDQFDLGDMQVLAAKQTAGMIKVQVHKNGTASMDLPRAEVGQGITTTIAMLIAEELDLPITKVNITLANARPSLQFNQLTGGSNSVRSLYTPVRQAAAAAKAQLVSVAADRWGAKASSLKVNDGVITHRDGRTVTYGALAEAAAVTQRTPVQVRLKNPADFKLVGKGHTRIDAHDIVTGQKVFAMDLHVPGAMPAMVCRPPTINGTVKRVHNRSAVRKMPGITHVVNVPTGVAVRGRTFGQCIDAVRALKVSWGPGSADLEGEHGIQLALQKAELPFVNDAVAGQKKVERRFTFFFASNSALETNCAIAKVTKKNAEIWGSLKVPIVAQQYIAAALNLPMDKVTVHVTQGGGSFGRHLFHDAALEAAHIAKATGRPVKLMWHRTDDFRQGRVHPMCTSNVRAVYSGNNVLSYEQRHTGVETDFRHGFGDIITALGAEYIPGGNKLGYGESIWELTQNVSYNYGTTDQTLREIDMSFHTGSMRNIYSPDACVAQELITDELAREMGMDPYEFRLEFIKNARSKAVLQKAAKLGNWGRKMPHGTAQGIAFHGEYKGCTAALVEIDCRPHTTHRKIPDAYTGPRVTKVTFVADVGLAINPKGLEAQMMGGIMDGIALALTSSLHFTHGHFLEGSWDNYYYTRQWNVPPKLTIHIMPTTTGDPGGAGELGVAASKAAVACAYARATGKVPISFPINHDKPLGFKPLPFIPSIPQSPTNGLPGKH